MNKAEKFDNDLRELSLFAKAISHPARLAILRYLAESKTCISGDISDNVPLSRTTVSQHLKELRNIGFIHGEIEGLKINYCLCQTNIDRFRMMIDKFLEDLRENSLQCKI